MVSRSRSGLSPKSKTLRPEDLSGKVQHSSTFTRAWRGRDVLVTDVARHLTERDHFLLALIAEHRVFTTEQVCELGFDNLTTARHRLTKLHELLLLYRLAPFQAMGSAPYHYVLGELGAYVVAAHQGREPKDLKWRPDRMLALARSSHLAHLVAPRITAAEPTGMRLVHRPASRRDTAERARRARSPTTTSAAAKAHAKGEDQSLPVGDAVNSHRS